MRVRLRFAKLGKIRFTSQRDVARMWERALRRAGLPLAYSAGFSPRPQLSFGLALPTGCESLAEYLDVDLDDARPETAGIEVWSLPARLSVLLPAGIDVEEAAPVDRSARLPPAAGHVVLVGDERDRGVEGPARRRRCLAAGRHLGPDRPGAQGQAGA